MTLRCDFYIPSIFLQTNKKITLARILLSMSDQESIYEKFWKEISTSVEALAFRQGDGPLKFPSYHIHDISHQVENAQAFSERINHFDGRHSYDLPDVSLLLTSAKDVVVERMLKGVSHTAISQLDKHSDE